MAALNIPKNIAAGLACPDGVNSDEARCVKGDYEYWHYGCNEMDDRGWGCGYRTLQTLCSWVMFQQRACGKDARKVPDLKEIQEALVTMQDKPAEFMGSRDWIGSVEVGLCIDYFYDVPCKIVHVGSGKELQDKIDILEEHFATKGSPVMMGGDSDSASKGILGVCRNKSEAYFLILDPHYYGTVPTQDTLREKKFLLWRPVSSFIENSFYNMCLPQYKCY